jgi:hypothetical protein
MAWGGANLMQKTNELAKKNHRYIWLSSALILLMVYPILEVFTIAINPFNANIPFLEKDQYVISNFWGVRDSLMPYLKSQAQNRKIFVGSAGLTGTFQAIEEYEFPGDNIITKGYLLWGVSHGEAATYDSDVKDLMEHAALMPTYFVGPGIMKINSHIKQIKRIPCRIPDNMPCSSILVYKIIR